MNRAVCSLTLMCTDDLQRVFSGLQSKWIGRSAQIQDLVGQFGLCSEDPPVVLVHGPPGTGKSCITRDVLSTFGYCICTLGSLECDCSLAQLWTFVISGWQRELQKPRVKPSDIGDAWDAIKKVRQATTRPLCVLVDALDTGVELDHVSALLEFRSRSPVPFGILFVSSCPWTSLYPDATHHTAPQHIAFPAYERAEILQTLQRHRPERLSQHAFDTILHSFVKPAIHATRLLTDAETLLEMLLAELPTGCDDIPTVVEHLHKVCRAQSMSLAENFCGAPVDVRALTGQCGGMAAVAGGPIAAAVPLMEVPRMVKLLILAAHIAGNNRPAANRRVFSNEQQEKKRKGNAMGADRRADAAEEEASLQGQVFTPECWLQVFFKLVEQDHDPSNNSNSVAQPDVLSDSMQTNWLHSQMRQLACIHIVKQSTTGSDGVTGVGYTSEVSHSWAESLASSVDLNLKHFLVYV